MHVNIYGPMASGKTRYAEEFKKHYACTTIIDEGKVHAGRIHVPTKGRALILTIDPINAGPGVIENVTIYAALRAIGKTGVR